MAGVGIHEVCSAVQKLYFNTDVEVQQYAQKWLVEFQETDEAWSVAWEILNSEQLRTIEEQYIAANMLYLKFSKNWSHLDESVFPEVRQRLLELISKAPTSPRLLLTRLSTVLSVYIINTCRNFWPTSIPDIINHFQLQGDTASLLKMIEILRVLPEEYSTATLPATVRTEVRTVLESYQLAVFQLLSDILARKLSLHIDSYAMGQTVCCFTSWTMLGVPLNDVEPLLESIFSFISLTTDEDLVLSVIDGIINIVEHPYAQDFVHTICSTVIPLIAGLRETFDEAVQNDHTYFTCNLTRLAVSVGEAFPSIVIQPPDSTYTEACDKLVSLLMACTSIPGQYPTDETSSGLTFNFWYLISSGSCHLTEGACTKLKGTYVVLAHVLMRKARFPATETYDNWTADDKETFRCYRQDIADTIMYIYNILNDSLPNTLHNCLVESLRADNGWQETESVIFCFKAVVEALENYTDCSVSSFLLKLDSICARHQQCIPGCLELCGASAEWVSSFPEHLGTCLSFVLRHLDAHFLQASIALHEICQECIDHLSPHLRTILDTLILVIQNRKLQVRDATRTYYCVGRALSVLPTDELLTRLQQFVAPIMGQLMQGNLAKFTLERNLHILHSVLSAMDREDADNQHVAEVYKNVFPVLYRLCDIHKADAAVVTALCRIFKKTTYMLVDQGCPIAADMFTLVNATYDASPRNSILDLARTLILVLSSNAEHVPRLAALFRSLMESSVNAVERDTDLYEAYAQLATAVLSRYPTVIWEPSAVDLQHVIVITTRGLAQPETPVVRACAWFLAECANRYAHHQFVASAVAVQGCAVVQRILHGLAGGVRRQLVDLYTDVLYAFAKYSTPLYTRWLDALLATDGFPCERVDPMEKNYFAKTSVELKDSRSGFKTLVTTFSDSCRGLRAYPR